jgi:hypothetical protein
MGHSSQCSWWHCTHSELLMSLIVLCMCMQDTWVAECQYSRFPAGWRRAEIAPGGFDNASRSSAAILSLWLQVWAMLPSLYSWALPSQRSFLQGRSQMQAEVYILFWWQCWCFSILHTQNTSEWLQRSSRTRRSTWLQAESTYLWHGLQLCWENIKLQQELFTESKAWGWTQV